MKLKRYERNAKYYETDQMGIIHHSNYIRWFEEARVYAMEQIGIPYDEMEACGVVSPVLSVECIYKQSVKFNDDVEIEVEFLSFSGAKMQLSYAVYLKKTGELMTTGRSSHGFLQKNGRPVKLKKEFPQMYDCIIKALEK